MVERRMIVERWRTRQEISAVLVTLVRVEGSSYRRPGARLFIQAGEYAGSISGGCLEGEIMRKAAWLTRDGAVVERYSTMFDDTSEIPYGLGCGGVLDLLLEPAHSPEADALLRSFEQAQRGESFLCATLLPTDGHPLARVLWNRTGSMIFASDSLGAHGIDELAALYGPSAQTEWHTASITNQNRDIFVEQILPPQRLIIFGAGDDAQPLAHIAHALGWRVVVADGRAWLARPERFPGAERVVALDGVQSNVAALGLNSNDAVAMLTHSFEQDRLLLPSLLPLDLRYLGLLGARSRSHLLIEETARQLKWTGAQCLACVHAPVGLDLGGDNPEAVALSIVAEIQAVLNGKAAGSRNMAEEDLAHSPERPYVPARCPLDDPIETRH